MSNSVDARRDAERKFAKLMRRSKWAYQSSEIDPEAAKIERLRKLRLRRDFEVRAKRPMR
jgi:hypothetical protein